MEGIPPRALDDEEEGEGVMIGSIVATVEMWPYDRESALTSVAAAAVKRAPFRPPSRAVRAEEADWKEPPSERD